MKRIISIVLVVIAALSCFSITSVAKDTNVGSDNTLEEGACPVSGEVKILTIVVNYKGLEPTDSRETSEIYNMVYSDTYDDYIPTEKVGTQEDSLRSFYYRQSLGKLRISGDIYEYTTEKDYTHYLFSNCYQLTDVLVEEAIRNLNIDTSDYDSNNDGYVDSTIVYVRNSVATNPETKETEPLCGVNVSYCAADRENGVGYIATISNICGDGTCDTESNTALYHEFFHTLGFGDVYAGCGCNPFSDDNFGITMGSTVHESGSGGISAAHKIELGWISPIEVNYGEITISSSVLDENAYVIKIDGTHCFVVEYVSTYNESNKYYNDGEAQRGIRVWKIEYKSDYTKEEYEAWYNPWNYIVCKINDVEDSFASFDDLESLVNEGNSVDLYCSYKYNYTYSSYGTISSRTPIDYTYSGFSIEVVNANLKDCTIRIYRNKNIEDSGSLFRRIFEWIKTIFCRIKNILK